MQIIRSMNKDVGMAEEKDQAQDLSTNATSLLVEGSSSAISSTSTSSSSTSSSSSSATTSSTGMIRREGAATGSGNGAPSATLSALAMEDQQQEQQQQEQRSVRGSPISENRPLMETRPMMRVPQQHPVQLSSSTLMSESMEMGGKNGGGHHISDSVMYSLKWNEFDKQLSSGFTNLYYSQDFADVTLCSEGKSAQAHKVVLAMCSPYFRQIFKENPCKHPVVIIKGIKFHDLQHVLKFIYFGQVSVIEKEIQNFLEAAELLKLDGISSNDASSTNGSHRSKSNLELRAGTERHSRSMHHSGPGFSPILRRGPDYAEDSRKVDSIGGESHYDPRVSPINDPQMNHSQMPSPAGSVISHGKRRHNGLWRSPSSSSVIPADRMSPPEVETSNSSGSMRNSKLSPVIVENVVGLGPSHHRFFSSSADKMMGPGNISRSSSVSGGGGDTLGYDQPLPVMVNIDENVSSEGLGRHSDDMVSGEYELSIRNVETGLNPLKSFTTPSGMVVTSTLRPHHHHDGPSSNPPSPWGMGPQLKSPIPASPGGGGAMSHLNHHHHHPLHPGAASVIKGASGGGGAHGRGGPGLSPGGGGLSYVSNGPVFGKLGPSSEHILSCHSPSSVPAKKRFSQFNNHRFPLFPAVEISQERNFIDLEQRSLLKVGGLTAVAATASSSSSTGSPGGGGGGGGVVQLSALGPNAALSLVPRLKNQRHSQVPQSARYTTAEVDAMVDSVTNLSGPFVPCKICDKLVKRERLRAHIHECHLVHGEKIICPHCGVGLKSKGSYRVHVWRHRRGVLTKGLKSKRVIVQRPRPASPHN